MAAARALLKSVVEVAMLSCGKSSVMLRRADVSSVFVTPVNGCGDVLRSARLGVCGGADDGLVKLCDEATFRKLVWQR